MVMKLSIIILLVFLAFYQPLSGQELNCNINVITPRIEETDKHLYDNMRQNITEFQKGRKWTEDEFLPVERIECSFYITIQQRTSTDRFKAQLQVTSVRPVFASSYNSAMLNHLDKKFTFDFIEFQPVEFIEGSFISNLSAVLAFYTYIILGLDYDSYSKYGGTAFYEKARGIVSQAQGKEFLGWDAMDSKKNNRFWLVDQLLDQRFRPFRECLYEYHRLGLDKMSSEPESARNQIMDALKKLKRVHRDEPNSFLLQTFFTAKREEIIKIFADGTSSEKNELLDLINEIDVANASKYREKLK